jgi:hypothetical protein
MRIRYEVTFDDLVAFHQYHFDHSPAVRRQRLRSQWLIAVVSFAISLVAAVVLRDWIWMPGGILGAIGGALSVPFFHRRRIEQDVHRLYGEGENKGLFGEQELELTENELIARNSLIESRGTFRRIERVASNGKHTFIYTSAIMAYVIRHAGVVEGDLEAFLAALEQRLVEKTNEIPAEKPAPPHLPLSGPP